MSMNKCSKSVCLISMGSEFHANGRTKLKAFPPVISEDSRQMEAIGDNSSCIMLMLVGGWCH